MIHSASGLGGLGSSGPSACKNQHPSPRLQYPTHIASVSAPVLDTGESTAGERRTGSIVSARLVLIVRGEFLVLPVQKLAVLSGETSSGGFVELADASRF